MKIFNCDSCGSLVFFDNVKCLQCGNILGFLPSNLRLATLKKEGENSWRPLATDLQDQLYRRCENSERHEVCNWMVAANEPDHFCVSCRLNDLIPDLSVSGNLELWHKLEMAKRRLIYTNLRLELPMDAVPEEGRPALRFKFIGDIPGGPPALTGHDNGIVSVNISEADDAERERRRVSLHEPFRTLLGHLRHEVAHYYWDRLVVNSGLYQRFQQLFGDETADYAASLERYYKQGPVPDWQTHFVSTYASAHPWEDWAETGAHYFHIIDMVETAASFGISLKATPLNSRSVTVTAKEERELQGNFDDVLESWFPLSQALNSLNRGMGLLDIYPFVLTDPVIEKLRFVHEVIQSEKPKTGS